ncbi:VPS10 domain-containing protein [Pontibacter sp. G13]|uniref:WD40/YVTN/BNR-like repeat-containing protein n=1 Tax=Pontibacter sp. G13 TaxID=3074898 RepID=UPI00288BEAB9|nr:glycosyl hydrolase [Pontibacter sp. G13]WNJ18223.1 glycosyl hydrolase [Pontibacter sp. G13]
MKRFTLLVLCGMLFSGSLALAQKKKRDQEPATSSSEENRMVSSTFSGLKFRNVGPAFTSGRVSDIAVNPDNHSEYYVAVASGGVWKTVNHGTTFQPIFDGQASYSVGCVSLDPNNPAVVWVGTGENNGQRSVAYGDGIYKSTDGGKSWKSMGLKNSEHIARIYIDPRNSQTVFAAVQGPLWSNGGERGLYKSTDGGESWENVLEVDEYTGVSDLVVDPRNPDVMYASTWQRQRKVWTFISGGPGSAIYKSTDGGETWKKSQSGLPGGDLGRIGLAISPVNPDVLYAIVEADSKRGGFFRSTDRGANWEKRNKYQTSGNYYQEIFCDPVEVGRVYVMDTYGHFTVDGGKTFNRIGERTKHVDNHAIWINPNDNRHMIWGCDGGVYETYDQTKTWHFKDNLPIIQFYKVAVDNDAPFYNIYGGTQDNNSMGGPSRTISANGIPNADWYITNGGDGFESQVDPENPNIVYAQAQYGWLVRYDRASGENMFIQPQPGKGEPGLRWNWDAPLLISPHDPARLYFGANRLFRTDDRGNEWTAVSGDLSRQVDRNKLPVMGKVWSVDAVAKNRSTSNYGNIVALDESPIKEGLLYVGTDDGLIQISQDGGGSWTKINHVSGVPEMTYVNMLVASQHDVNVVYAAFNNHKQGDFKPYLFKSSDQGKSWTKLSGGLPARGSVYAIAEDHVDPNLLFAGTEFGLFFTTNGGQDWVQLKGGLPTIAIRDIAIQKRENDLVLASFGRGFYVLDDYSPLRQVSEQTLTKQAHLFPIKDALMYVESRPLGLRGKGFQGDNYYAAENPPVGAVFTLYLNDAPKSLKDQRSARERELEESGESVSYPTLDEMRAEDREESSYLLFTITDTEGKVVNRVKAPMKKGLQRVVWNGHYPATTPVKLNDRGPMSPFSERSTGPRANPGDYQVSVAQVINGRIQELVGAQPFKLIKLENTTLPAENTEESLAFLADVAELQRQVTSVNAVQRDLTNRIKHIKKALLLTPEAPTSLLDSAKNYELDLMDINMKLNGDATLSRRYFETPPSINGRIGQIVYGMGRSTSSPTQTMQDGYAIAKEELAPVREEVQQLTQKIQTLETKLEGYGAPYTPGRSLIETER